MVWKTSGGLVVNGLHLFRMVFVSFSETKVLEKTGLVRRTTTKPRNIYTLHTHTTLKQFSISEHMEIVIQYLLLQSNTAIKKNSVATTSPLEIVELLNTTNNFSPELRKALNDKLSANKKYQAAIGVKSKEAFALKLEDPLNKGVEGGDLMGVPRLRRRS